MNPDNLSLLRKLQGIVVKSTGSWYKVLTEDAHYYNCTIKGKFRLSGSKATNPITIGDRVIFHLDEKLNSAVIDQIEERKNFLVRKSTNLSRQTHVIAANIDHCCIITSLKNPSISSAFIDRFIVISAAHEIEPVIIFNKIDLLEEDETDILNYYVQLYNKLGYQCFHISAKKATNTEQIRNFIQGKTCLFAGQSGVGKSTLLNQLYPELDLKTKIISNYSGRGQHATTFYEMFHIEDKTFIIDSPGIRELGLYDFEAFEIGLFFPEIKEMAPDCKFNTCLHQNEPGCAVTAAVEKGKITEERYINYLKILEDFEK